MYELQITNFSFQLRLPKAYFVWQSQGSMGDYHWPFTLLLIRFPLSMKAFVNAFITIVPERVKQRCVKYLGDNQCTATHNSLLLFNIEILIFAFLIDYI